MILACIVLTISKRIGGFRSVSWGGAKVERRRREPSQGAKGAKGVECREGVSPSPQGKRSGKEAVPPPRNFFRY